MINWLLFNIQVINFWYALSGLGLLAATVVLLYDYVGNQQRIFKQFVAPYLWPMVVIVSLGGVATTLLYSEVFGFIPCSLCWLQRVALYSFALLALVAFKIKDTQHFPVYGIALSIFGFCVAVYQYVYQALPKEMLESGIMPCLADGTADCSKKVIEVFGFVTFPFLSAVLFVSLGIVLLHVLRSNKY